MTAKAGKNLSHPKKQQQYHLQIRQRIHAKAVSFSSQPQQQHHQPIAHQCDGCNLFPITNLRYTLEGEDIDLCKKCFE
eukprot:CAMPEP_0194352836 /NCGR_PEP_ID=MMETSP0174-20130528/1267_1 /TAXON_ID=216777 /ORGANISM="Proboscia alata, Strain PI-D3" /LENGTH=77 /DNA_ID=CAMNT_0039121143 /DNA_START=691 /DNA_END=924 /DNA_ORIENTATION=-